MYMITVTKENNVWMKINAEVNILREIYDHFSVYAADYRYHPKFKNHVWDGKINFFQAKTRRLPIGLIKELATFATNNGYKLNVDDALVNSFNTSYTKEEFVKELENLNMSAYGEKIHLRDYQMMGIYLALKTMRKLFISNTSSGKSAIIYGITRLIDDKIPEKVLIIVPSTNLVEQMYNDFADYSSDDSWGVEENCCKIYSGHEYQKDKKIVISTWQSLQKRPPDFFEQFSCVMVDEAHNSKAVVLDKILKSCTQADYRFGFTGTLPKEECDKMTIVANIGEPITLSTTKEAIENGYVTKLNIDCHLLRHELNSDLRKFNYNDEVDYLCFHEERNNYICELAKKLEGNTIILTSRVENHGKVLFEQLTDDSNGKQVFQIFGEVKTEEREKIRQTLEKENNCIVVGNFQILSTGWSVRNVHNVIFAFPSKSFIRVVQSIGRVLRKNDGKETATLYDIADGFVKKDKDIAESKNYTFKHFRERLNIYSEEQHNYNITEIKL